MPEEYLRRSLRCYHFVWSCSKEWGAKELFKISEDKVLGEDVI